MALTLEKEDGTGLAAANSYADEADGNAYHEGHLYAAAWDGPASARREAALVMASRLIDAVFVFNGKRATPGQALQWPRVGCLNRDGATYSGGAALVPSNVVPKAVADATIETARALLVEDRTANPLGEGMRFTAVGDLQQTFDAADRRPMLPHLALAMLRSLGHPQTRGSGMATLTRS